MSTKKRARRTLWNPGPPSERTQLPKVPAGVQKELDTHARELAVLSIIQNEPDGLTFSELLDDRIKRHDIAMSDLELREFIWRLILQNKLLLTSDRRLKTVQ